MKAREVAVILATGGMGLVRAAYSAGKPAYGVGPGNAPAFIERSEQYRPTKYKKNRRNPLRIAPRSCPDRHANDPARTLFHLRVRLLAGDDDGAITSARHLSAELGDFDPRGSEAGDLGALASALEARRGAPAGGPIDEQLGWCGANPAAGHNRGTLLSAFPFPRSGTCEAPRSSVLPTEREATPQPRSGPGPAGRAARADWPARYPPRAEHGRGALRSVAARLGDGHPPALRAPPRRVTPRVVRVGRWQRR